MSEVQCSAKHTTWNPTIEEFRCPKCQGKCGDEFYIEEPDANAHPDCTLLHDEDTIVCTKCGYGTSGKKFCKDEMKKRDLVVCPCCKGRGHVSSKVAEEYTTKGGK